jgi:hypothetical protein
MPWETILAGIFTGVVSPLLANIAKRFGWGANARTILNFGVAAIIYGLAWNFFFPEVPFEQVWAWIPGAAGIGGLLYAGAKQGKKIGSGKR